MTMLSTLTQLLVFTLMVTAVLGHGRLRDPPSRASMWRDGFPENPTNYQDNELFCGGFAVSLSEITFNYYTQSIRMII